MSGTFDALPQPKLLPIPGRKRLWRVEEDYIIDLPECGKKLKIWWGFTTDGASIPPLFRPLVGQPFDPNFMAAALPHDALYAAELLTRKECDLELAALMRMNGPIAARRAEAFYAAVRLGGRMVWMRHTKRGVAQARELCEFI